MKKLNNPESTFRPGDHVLIKNNQFIALNKPAGIPVQPDQTEDKALLHLAEIYTKSKLLLIHRLDRPVTGLVLFAKTKTAQRILSDDFKERRIQKTYLAVVRNTPELPEATLVHYIRQDIKENKSVAFAEDTPGAQRSVLTYRILANSENYCLLLVQPETGRHHQIRAQLAAIGCPVKGDVKYGARRSNPDRSIHLHAWKLEFKHPVDQSTILLTAPLPQDSLWQSFQPSLPNV